MMELADSLTAAIARTEALFGCLSDEEASAPVRNGGWSRKQIIGHLIDSAANNHQRFVLLMLSRQVIHPGYEQAGWVKSQRYQ
ncbi:MAG TPA: DinB family protein, partial [Bryobacteraceae bacterium]|nr:DinB family protein [Bryobacteraceae bacterium]